MHIQSSEGDMEMRLPIKFEQEVLKKHRIEWDDVVGYMTRGYNSSYDDYIIHDTERYELAGIALEYLVHNGWDILNGGIVAHYRGESFYDQDFCTCIFKAVREIWND